MFPLCCFEYGKIELQKTAKLTLIKYKCVEYGQIENDLGIHSTLPRSNIESHDYSQFNSRVGSGKRLQILPRTQF